jgi:hypothetical protein
MPSPSDWIRSNSYSPNASDVILVNLAVFKVVFFLGAEGANAIFKGTDHGGISFLAAMIHVIGPPLEKGKSLQFSKRIIKLFAIGNKSL